MLHQLLNSICLPFPTLSLHLPLYLYSVTESCIMIMPISFQTSSSSLCQHHRPCSGSVLLLWPLTFGSTCSGAMLVVLVSKQYLDVVSLLSFILMIVTGESSKQSVVIILIEIEKATNIFLWVHRLKNPSETSFSGVFNQCLELLFLATGNTVGKQ